MKKFALLLLTFSLMTAFSGCGGSRDVEIHIVIPAGTTEEFVYSEAEVSPVWNRIEVRTTAQMPDTAVTLQPSSEPRQQTAEGTSYLTHGVRVRLEAEKGEWYRIGVKAHNPGDTDLVFVLTVSDAMVRIE